MGHFCSTGPRGHCYSMIQSIQTVTHRIESRPKYRGHSRSWRTITLWKRSGVQIQIDWHRNLPRNRSGKWRLWFVPKITTWNTTRCCRAFRIRRGIWRNGLIRLIRVFGCIRCIRSKGIRFGHQIGRRTMTRNDGHGHRRVGRLYIMWCLVYVHLISGHRNECTFYVISSPVTILSIHRVDVHRVDVIPKCIEFTLKVLISGIGEFHNRMTYKLVDWRRVHWFVALRHWFLLLFKPHWKQRDNHCEVRHKQSVWKGQSPWNIDSRFIPIQTESDTLPPRDMYLNEPFNVERGIDLY